MSSASHLASDCPHVPDTDHGPIGHAPRPRGGRQPVYRCAAHLKCPDRWLVSEDGWVLFRGELLPSPTVHWAATMVGPGGHLVTNAGCLPDARLGHTARTAATNPTTDDPAAVTCPVCQCLPSYRRER